MLLDSLPSCVYSQLLQDYLGIQDLCRLDSSLCSGPSRAAFLLTLQTYPLVLPVLDVKDERHRLGWEWLMRRGMTVRSLYLRGHSFAETPHSPDALRAVAPVVANRGKMFNRIQCLTLNNAMDNHQVDSWLDIIRSCPRLQTLTLYCNHLLAEEKLDVLQHCPGLKKLAVHHAFSISAEFLMNIPSYCPRLEELVMSQSKSLNAAHLLALLQSPSWQRSLKKVSFHNCYGRPTLTEDEAFYGHTDSRVTTLSKQNVVEELNLSYSWNVADDTVTKLLLLCPRLKVLSLRGCNILTEHLETVAKHCPLITSVDLSSCHNLTDEMLASFLQLLVAKSTSTLQELQLGFCRRLTDVSLTAIGKYVPGLKRLTLEQRMFTDEGLLALSEGCHSLEELALRYCFNIQHEGIVAMIKQNPGLKSLVLRECPGVTAETLAGIAQCCCTSLEVLDLEGNHSLPEAGLLKVVTRCSKLKVLNLSRCELVSDVVVKAISKHCCQLNELYLKRCCFLSDQCFLYLSDIKRLRVLDVSFCTKIRLESHLVTFARSSVWLESLHVLGSRIGAWDDETKKVFKRCFPEDKVKVDLVDMWGRLDCGLQKIDY